MNQNIIEEYAAILKKRVGLALSIDECKHFVANVMHSIIWHGPDEVPPNPFYRVVGDDGLMYKCASGIWFVRNDKAKVMSDTWLPSIPNRWRYPAP